MGFWKLLAELLSANPPGGAQAPHRGRATNQSRTVLRPAASSRPHSKAPKGAGGPPKPGEEDRLMLIGFADKAFPVLLPTRMGETGVVRRIRELGEPRRFKGGTTNLAA